MKNKKARLIQIMGILISLGSIVIPIGLADNLVLYFTLYPGGLIFLFGLIIDRISTLR